MWIRWFPWRYVLSRLARSRGFIDPVALLSRLHRFAQPSEVTEPIELLRAGVVFHARGLINTRTIQHNLDWVWPFWVERQFNPRDIAFVPRAFSITHVNLTHRNWTAVGQPDCDWLPIVDPRGLVTPLFDGWSLDAWVITDDGKRLLPSRAEWAEQRLLLEDGPAVETSARQDGSELRSVVDVVWEGNKPCCRVQVSGRSAGRGWLVVAIRPVNPEGVSFIHDIKLEDDRRTLRVNGEASVHLDRTPDRVCMSHYHRGDVLQDLGPAQERESVVDDVGLATAAALYRLEPERSAEVLVRVPLVETRHPDPAFPNSVPTIPRHPTSWKTALEGVCILRVPDGRMRFLFDAALRMLVLHAPGEVYPGPYTYKRFWFRDAAFILEALLAAGLLDRVRRAIERFPGRQNRAGYFRSQEGEWDSNGEAIWIIDRYRRLSGRRLNPPLVRAVARGADWIRRKRLSDALDRPHAGLMPAGFSAEHLGPNDFYYWDDFWSAAGLRAAAAILREADDARLAGEYEREAQRLLAAVDRSIARLAAQRGRPGVPASPYRRMDAGAIGSVAASYPLRLWEARDPRLLATVEFLLHNCMVRGGFFQDMIHSGINAYLTLHLAQVLLRAGDRRFFDLVRAVAELASPTGQWPEAIHPHTGGGCMGDGQHLWAAAEWVLMMRNLFVREEGDRLVLASGLPDEWLGEGTHLKLGPTPTPFGPITVAVVPHAEQVEVCWEAAWRTEPPVIEVALPGTEGVTVSGKQTRAAVRRSTARGREVRP
ncbi:MAG TPA: hypothetical protein VNK04_08815 [Gemmataceae bacterium]|nr:hypothetical protein [Gemmataceae bacterium]